MARFSTTSSTPRCTSIDVVREEKFMPRSTFLPMSRLARYLAMVTVFAVPLSPTNRTGLPFATKQSKSHVLRTVSTVGTRMEANLAPGSISSGVTEERQVNHFFFSTSKRYSYKLALGKVVGDRPSPSLHENPASFLMNASTRSRSLKPCFWITDAPKDHTRQNTNVASSTAGSTTTPSSSFSETASFSVFSVAVAFSSSSPPSPKGAESKSMHSSILHSCVTRFRFVCGTVCCGALPMTSPSMPSTQKSMHLSTYLLISLRRISACSWFTRLLHQVQMYGSYSRFLGSTYTIPHRETVAGEAYCRSATSNSSLTWSTKRIRSPFGNVSSLLSSITEFMFSTHTASTSPSKTMYRNSSLSGGNGRVSSRKMFDKSPSVQSRVSGSSSPYSSDTVCALGFTMCSFVCTPIFVCDRASVLMITDLPPPVFPTTMVVCRVSMVSYSWITLSTCCEGPVITLYPFSARSPSTTSFMRGYRTRGQSRPGNRSEIKPRNSGTSSKTNFGRFMSRSARIRTISSLKSGEPRLSAPAITSTDFNARKPKS